MAYTLIQQINAETPSAIEREIRESREELEALNEVVDTPPSREKLSRMSMADVSESLYELQQRLEAARRGLGVANKIKNPDEKKKHLSQIMTNMNKIGGGLRRAQDALRHVMDADHIEMTQVPG